MNEFKIIHDADNKVTVISPDGRIIEEGDVEVRMDTEAQALYDKLPPAWQKAVHEGLVLVMQAVRAGVVEGDAGGACWRGGR